MIAAMVRHAPTGSPTSSGGGKPIAAVVDAELKDLAVAATAAVGADFAGVDIIYGADGRPSVLEVNSMPAWAGVQKVTKQNIAAALAADLVAALDRHAPRSALGRPIARRAGAFVIVPAGYRGCLRGGVSRRARCTEARQCACFRRRTPHVGRRFHAQRGRGGRAVDPPGARVGQRILGAVEATRAIVGTNTNLGIILLCAPLAAAAETATTNLRAAVADMLENLDIADAEPVFQAIALAAPGGLGQVERHDVRAPAAGAAQAMAEAADRDRIAQQYSTGFADIFDAG